MSSNLEPQIQRLAEAIFQLGRINPYADARQRWEREAVGDEPAENVITALGEVAEELADYLQQIFARQAATPNEREWYSGIVFHTLRERYRDAFREAHEAAAEASPDDVPEALDFYESFTRDFDNYFRVCGPPLPEIETAPHLFACADQMLRAESAIDGVLVGTSVPVRRLRAAMWQSVFTYDALRHRRFLYRTVGAGPTLVQGPIGAPTRAVARAIAHSLFLPFDPSVARFIKGPTLASVPLAALTSDAVRGALFGLRKGAGNPASRPGAFALAGPGGTVLLEDVHELTVAQQIEVLSVLETGRFRQGGGDVDEPFEGSVVATTNIDLSAEVASGGFDRALHLRLGADTVTVPTLRSRLDAEKTELIQLVSRMLGDHIPELYLEDVAQEVHDEIVKGRGDEWPWPGNDLELRECVRSVLLEGRCPSPDANVRLPAPAGRFVALEQGTMSLAEVAYQYCRHVWELQGTYKSAAEVLGIDWRTVKNYVEAAGTGQN